MSYLEMVTKALKNRSVNSLAKEWGVKQKTLDRYVKGETLPDYATAKIMAKEAGISAAEMLDTLAEEEVKRRSKLEKISASFRTLLRAANAYWTRVPAAA
ncbi:MAG: helix-turn-helix domain-containing protein [Telluria sp.]|nr:helix-turn-helix domain-containing protein [Telluria sp.]